MKISIVKEITMDDVKPIPKVVEKEAEKRKNENDKRISPWMAIGAGVRTVMIYVVVWLFIFAAPIGILIQHFASQAIKDMLEPKVVNVNMIDKIDIKTQLKKLEEQVKTNPTPANRALYKVLNKHNGLPSADLPSP